MKSKKGYVYFALAEGTFTSEQKVRVKIGRTCASVEKRHQQIEQQDRKNRGTTGPCQIISMNEVLVSDCHKVEKRLHGMFVPYKYRTYENDEWFELGLLQIVVLCRLRSEHLEELLLQSNPTYADLCEMVFREEQTEAEPIEADQELSGTRPLYRVIGKEGIELQEHEMESALP